MKNDYSKILVTGGAGWLGKGLLKALESGIPECEALTTPLIDAKIKVLVLPHEKNEIVKHFPAIEIVEGDLTNKDDCEAFFAGEADSILFHLAGIIHPKSRVKEFYGVNVDGSRTLLAEAERAGVKRAVVMSSNSPIGCNPNNTHQFDESSPYNPYMNYGESKRQLELLVHEFQNKGKLETVIIRAPWFYGPFQPDRQLEFFEMIKNGKGPIVGDGNNMRSMAYVDNLAQGLILAAITEAANGETYWIADEQPYSMNQILNTIERLLKDDFGQNCKYGRLKLPSFASDVAWVIDKVIQSIGLYHQKFHVLSEMNKNIACSVDKAKVELGYKPTISLEEGMRRSLAEFYKG